jgi:hypothetical protein
MGDLTNRRQVKKNKKKKDKEHCEKSSLIKNMLVYISIILLYDSSQSTHGREYSKGTLMGYSQNLVSWSLFKSE